MDIENWRDFMQHVYAGTGVALFTMMLMPLYRVGFGPTAIDRIVAVNVIGTKTAVLLVVIGEIFGRIEMFVDFALAYALLNFLASIAVARFFFKTRAASGELDPLP